MCPRVQCLFVSLYERKKDEIDMEAEKTAVYLLSFFMIPQSVFVFMCLLLE